MAVTAIVTAVVIIIIILITIDINAVGIINLSRARDACV